MVNIKLEGRSYFAGGSRPNQHSLIQHGTSQTRQEHHQLLTSRQGLCVEPKLGREFRQNLAAP